MPKSLIHSFLILTSIILTYLWSKNPALAYYNLQITGLIIIFYFVARTLVKNLRTVTLLLDAMVFTSLTLLLVSATGAVHSPVFFLLYFLLFAISLLFEPLQAILVTISLLLIFLIEGWTSLDNQALVNLATLILITPLAIILGKKYLETLENLGKIQILRKIISKEETDSLLWISTQAKPTLSSIINSFGDLLIYFNSVGTVALPNHLTEKLKQIHNDLILLYKSTDTLKGAISDNQENETTKPE